MKWTEKRGVWILLILLVLAALSAWILWPGQEPEGDADLVVVLDTALPAGSVGVSYTRPDGSQAAEHVCNADGSLFARGERVLIQEVGWPLVVTVWEDIQSTRLLTKFTVEQAPDAQYCWEAVVSDGKTGLTTELDRVPRG